MVPEPSPLSAFHQIHRAHARVLRTLRVRATDGLAENNWSSLIRGAFAWPHALITRDNRSLGDFDWTVTPLSDVSGRREPRCNRLSTQ